jgi:hypothetical protein
MYFDNSWAFPALMAIEIPPGILDCSCTEAPTLKVSKKTGIKIENLIVIIFISL